ncbi:MAG: hypothetical protein EOO48_02370 [Flavobacterium sp.]|nr:MAG: hypothetical protein EOO48_02370 [Flavobacterium sp.]
MKTAEFLLKWMDEIQRFMSFINTWVDKGSAILQTAKVWVQKAVDWIERIIESLVETTGGRKTHTSQLISDEYMFV